MPTLNTIIDAFVASREFDSATISRLHFWNQTLGDKEIAAITPDQVDQSILTLLERGKLAPIRNSQYRLTGKPLSGATINRYITQLGSVFKCAKRLRLLPRSFISPLVGIEKSPEPVDPERYLRPEQVDKLLKVARALDNRWGRMEALITMAYHTGLRVGNLMALTWSEVDFESRTARVLSTKNGEPIVAALSIPTIKALKMIPDRTPDGLLFEGRLGKPFNYRRLWQKITKEAGMEGRNFHQLRHGCGYALASKGINQAQIMAVMGHRSFAASWRYMHHNTRDKQAVISQVFDHA